MSITITVSEGTEAKIRRRAESTGVDVEKIVSDLVEEAWDEHFPENARSHSESSQDPLAPFTGMFSSGFTDTAERHSEILRESVRMPGGFAND
jgi:hypothetical protein